MSTASVMARRAASRFAARVGIVVAAAVAALILSATAFASTWNSGDVVVGVSNGSYNVYTQAGVLKDALTAGTGFTTGCAFNNDQTKLFTTYFSDGQVVTFDNAHPHASSVFTTGLASPESVVFDKLGNVYVTQVGGGGINKYDASGNLLTTFNVGRTDWIDLAADQTTILFTTEDSNIYRLDTTTSTVTIFGTDPGNRFAALRILPDGTVLSAGQAGTITRFSAAGIPIQHYSDAVNSAWFALNLDPNGTSFWSADYNTSNLVKFNIATGAVEGGFNTGTASFTVFGVCLKGEITVGGGDQTKPTCELTSTSAGPPAQIQVTVQDTGSGLKTVEASTVNAASTTTVFTSGSTSPQVVTATKIDQAQGASLALKVTDVAGNVTLCDPVFGVHRSATLNGKSLFRFQRLLQTGDTVTVSGGLPGVQKLDLFVNGHAFHVRGVSAIRAKTINIASAMRPGSNNLVIAKAYGSRSGTVTLTITG